MTPLDSFLADDLLDTSSWIGWGDVGKIDRLETESIATRFFCVVVPLWPSHSLYRTRSNDGREVAIKLPLQLRSVVLGYLRATLGLAAAVLVSAAFAGSARFAPLVFVGVLLAAFAAMLTFGAGRLGPEERERRMLLRRVVGMGAPPELLPADLADSIREDLVETWGSQSRIAWDDAIASGTASELLVAIADYHRRPTLVARARQNLARGEDHLRWN